MVKKHTMHAQPRFHSLTTTVPHMLSHTFSPGCQRIREPKIQKFNTDGADK